VALYWAAVAALGAVVVAIAWRLAQHFRYVHHMRRPERAALAEMEAAWNLLPQTGYLVYLFELTRLTKEYLSGRFELPALPQTTTELLDTLQDAPVIPEALQPGLRDFFLRCDQLRFGSASTDRSEMEQAHQFVRGFVMATRWERPKTREAVRQEKRKMRSRPR